MANIFTDLAPDFFKAADQVSREMTGFTPAVTINADDSERGALNQPVRSHFTRSVAAIDRNVAMTISEGTDQTVDSKTISITKDRAVEIPWTGEDIRKVNSGSGFETIYGDQVMQAMRTLANEIETDLAIEAAVNASRAYGTAGTTPFATAADYTDASFVKKIIVDNGGGEFGNQLVLNTTAGATIQGKQTAANIAGSDIFQQRGIIMPLAGLDIRQSAQVVTGGTNAITANVTVTGVNAVGATTINLTTDATGAVSGSAGDIVTFAGDGEKYVLAADVTIGNSATGDIVIASPGLRTATAGSEAVSGVGAAAKNVAFQRSAIELAVRAPSVPIINGVARDSAIERMMVTDSVSGIPFEVSLYLGQGKAMMQVAVAWGKKAWKPEHIALLLG